MGRVVLKRVKRRVNTAYATRANANGQARNVKYIDSEKFNQFNPSVLGLGDNPLGKLVTSELGADVRGFKEQLQKRSYGNPHD